MKRIISILFTAAVLAACTGEEKPDGGKTENTPLEISAYTLAESAEFGETVSFSVTVPENAVANSLTAALIKGGKQLSSTTVREAVGGTFAGELAVPYTKNIERGEYDVMFMALGANSSDRAEKTVKINLSHPDFSAVAFVAADGTRYDLAESDDTAEMDDTWSYTGALPASLSGYFEAKTADNVVYNFGGKNIDNVEFGSTSSMELYSYEDALEYATIAFDLVTLKVTIPLNAMVVSVPATADPAYPGTLEVDFKKGQVVVFKDLGDLWVDVDFFDNNGDGSYTFRAEGGKYRLTNQSDWGSLRTERLSDNGDLGSFRWDETGNITVNEAIWCLGNYNFGKPKKREVRDGRTFSDWETYDGYCMAKIDDYKYQITLRVHNYASWKFFQTKLDWGDFGSANYDLANSSLEKCYLISIVGSDGNFQQGQNVSDPNKYEYPLEGVVLRFTFDVTNPLGIKATVEDVSDQNLM